MTMRLRGASSGTACATPLAPKDRTVCASAVLQLPFQLLQQPRLAPRAAAVTLAAQRLDLKPKAIHIDNQLPGPAAPQGAYTGGGVPFIAPSCFATNCTWVCNARNRSFPQVIETCKLNEVADT